MWVWEVDDEVEPIAFLLSNLWELLLLYAQDCYAMLVDVDQFKRIHDRCDSYYLMVNLRWLL